MQWIRQGKGWVIRFTLIILVFCLIFLGGRWGFRVGIVYIGLYFILKGIYLKPKNKEDLAIVSTPLGGSPLGCVIGLIVSLLFGGFLKSMPLWFVKSLWILLGIGVILFGIMS